MKSLLLVVLLAAAATAAVVSPKRFEGDEVADVDVNEMPIVSDGHEVIDDTAVATRSSLSLGTIGPFDIQLPVYDVGVDAIPNGNFVWERTFTPNRPITAIRVNQVGGPHGATSSLVGGGIGQLSATIRIRSALNRGFRYRIQLYVRF